MDWLFGALAVSALFGIINNLDSHIISRRMPGARAFLLLACLLILVFIQPFIFLFPLPSGLETSYLLSAVASALLRAVAIIIMLVSFRSEEVVGVVPLVYAYPVLVALLAIPLLGESLNVWQWLAVFIVVAGAVLVALRPRAGGTGRWLGKYFPALVGAAALFAAADLSGKYALEQISHFNLYWLSMLALCVVSLAISLRPEVIRSLGSISRPRSTLALLFFNESLVVGAAILTYWAMKNGPISLVSTILAARPVFVFMTALALSRLFPGFVYWQSDRAALRYKFIATLLIIGGITAIYLA